MTNRLKKLILLGGDLAILHLALFLTIVMRYRQDQWKLNWQNHWPSFLVIFIIWLLIIYINNLYNLNWRIRSRQFLSATVNTVIASSLFSIIYFYLNVQSNIAPKRNLLIFIIIFVFCFFAWHSLYRFLLRSFLPQNNLAIIGLNSLSEKLLKELANNPAASYNTALIFKGLEEIEALASSVEEKNIHSIVVCDDFGNKEKLSQALFSCLPYKLNFFNYPDFYELLSGKVPIEAIGPDWFLANLKTGQKNYYNFFKWLFDLILALMIFIFTLPFWLLISLGIKITGRGPIFFKQTRLGEKEKEFKIIKFRTMRTENNNFAPTEEDDHRITRFGSFLRKTRLDEIPQVINILKGEMSFIGPRPERPEIISELEKKIPFYKTRLLIKPGLTGWDQISGHYHSSSLEDTYEKLQYDLFYLEHRSFYLDLSIILKTLATMMSRSGR